jgi:hypothetical protein
MDKIVLAKDLPKELTESILRDLSIFTIAFLGAEVPASRRGSGVLVSAGNNRAILTAHHVTEGLPREGRFGIFLEPTNHLHSVDTDDVLLIKIARAGEEWEGPDLAAILLKPRIASTIAAKKLFFNLDLRRERMLKNPPDIGNGVWCATGFLDERCETRETTNGNVQYMYQFGGFGGPDELSNVDGYDRLEMTIDEDAPDMPKSWGGTSGGGLWQVALKHGEAGTIVASAKTLMGILFAELWDKKKRITSVRAHGRRSIYDVAHKVISEAEG